MRSKPTFTKGRHASRKAIWVGDCARNDDAQLDDELAVILQSHRAIIAGFCDVPPLQDVRASLEKLLKLGGDERTAALRNVDSVTGALLITGALQWHRAHKRKEPLAYSETKVERQTPAVQREMIQHALNHLAVTTKTGRRKAAEHDTMLVRRLAEYWRSMGMEITNNMGDGSAPSPFLAFAQDCFLRVGRSVTTGALRPIVRNALKAG